MLLGNNIDDIGSESNMMRRQKGSTTKISVSCPQAIKTYNTYMGGVDLMYQLKSSYQLNRRSKFRFYLRLFFDLLNVAYVNAFISNKKLENTELILKDFKLLIAERMIGSFVSRKNSFSNSRPSKRSRKSLPGPNPQSHIGQSIQEWTK